MFGLTGLRNRIENYKEYKFGRSSHPSRSRSIGMMAMYSVHFGDQLVNVPWPWRICGMVSQILEFMRDADDGSEHLTPTVWISVSTVGTLLFRKRVLKRQSFKCMFVICAIWSLVLVLRSKCRYFLVFSLCWVNFLWYLQPTKARVLYHAPT